MDEMSYPDTPEAPSVCRRCVYLPVPHARSGACQYFALCRRSRFKMEVPGAISTGEQAAAFFNEEMFESLSRQHRHVSADLKAA